MRTPTSIVLVSLLAGVAAADDRLGPPIAVESPSLEAPAAGDQIVLAVTGGPDGYLAVYHDDRDGRRDTLPMLRASLLDPEGRAIGPRGIRLPAQLDPLDPDPFTARHLADAATGGGMHLVVWEDTRLHGGVLAARVTPDGTVLDPEGFVVGDDGRQPSVAWDGRQFLVVWIDPLRDYVQAGGALRIARVSTEGKVFDPGGRLISGWPGAMPSIASDGDAALVVWATYPVEFGPAHLAVHAARVVVEDDRLEVAQRLIAGGIVDQREPAVAWDGTSYAVVWRAGERIRAVRVSADAVVGEARDLGRTGLAGDAVPTLTPNGHGLLVTWLGDRRLGSPVYAAMLDDDSAGEPYTLGDGAFALASTDAAPALVAWSSTQALTGADVLGALVLDAKPEVRPLATGPAWQIEPALVAQHGEHLAVWSTWGSQRGGADLHGVIVGAGGKPIGAAFPIVAALGVDRAPALAPAFDGYVVAWQHGDTVASVHVGERGQVWETGTPLGAAPGTADVALARGDGYLVAWTAGARVVGHMLDSLARPVGEAFELGTCEGICRAPTVAWAHTSFVVAWWSQTADGDRVDGVRVASGAVVARALALAGSAPVLAPRGDGFLLAYVSRAGVLTQPLDRLGRATDDAMLLADAVWPDAIALARTDGGYRIAWTGDGATSIADLDREGGPMSEPTVVSGALHASLASGMLVTEDAVHQVTVRALRDADADAPGQLEPGGCGCRGGDGGPATLGLILLAVVLAVPRRCYSAR